MDDKEGWGFALKKKCSAQHIPAEKSRAKLQEPRCAAVDGEVYDDVSIVEEVGESILGSPALCPRIEDEVMEIWRIRWRMYCLRW